MIEFTIKGTSYQAEEGMTWEEWVDSEYNTGNFVVSGGYIKDSIDNIYSNIAINIPYSESFVHPSDIILENGDYINKAGGGNN